LVASEQAGIKAGANRRHRAVPASISGSGASRRRACRNRERRRRNAGERGSGLLYGGW